MRVDLPEPETPVTPMSVPSGKSTVTFFRLLPFAPTMRSTFPLPSRRTVGTAMRRFPLRYSAVRVLLLSISAGVP